MARVREEKPRTFTDYVRLVEQLQSRRTFPLWYRGAGCARFKLLPSLYRHATITAVDKLARLESQLMTRFRQRSIPLHSRSLADDWDALFFMQRRKNRQLISQDPDSKKIDTELTKYDRFNRSTDDSESHRVRYDILRNRFQQAIGKPN